MANIGGQPGNTNQSKNKPWSDMIRKVAVQNPELLHKAVMALYSKAGEGDVASGKEIGDRLDGKAAQGLIVEGGDPNRPVMFGWMPPK